MTDGLDVRDLAFLENGPYSLILAPGECVGLTGPSGIGKTQFLRAVVDIIPHEGEICLNGRKCSGTPPCEWRKKVSLVPSESRWWYDDVGKHFPGNYLDSPQAEWMRQLGFTDDVMNWRVSRLSTGEKQRLAFLRAMINNPQILLLDEPTSALDRHYSTQLEKLLLDLRRQQRIGLIWVSHDIDQLQRVCDRIYRLEKYDLQKFH